MASQGSVSEDRHEEASVIRGHHVYKSVWTPEVGEELSTEDGNEHDKYAVAVIKDGYVVGHKRTRGPVCFAPRPPRNDPAFI